MCLRLSIVSHNIHCFDFGVFAEAFNSFGRFDKNAACNENIKNVIFQTSSNVSDLRFYAFYSEKRLSTLSDRTFILFFLNVLLFIYVCPFVETPN